jgi:TonB family protein
MCTRKFDQMSVSAWTDSENTSPGLEVNGVEKGGPLYFGGSTEITAVARAKRCGRAVCGVLIVLAAHIPFVWLWMSNFRTDYARSAERNIEVRIIAAVRQPLATSVTLLPARLEIVPAPDIQIEEPPAQASLISGGVDSTEVLPPRPDPIHHIPPTLPASLGAAGAVQVVLRVLVLADGSVSTAQIVTSSGRKPIDAFAIQFVQEHWRFLPATVSGRAIEDWTTAVMRFATT